MTMFKIPQLQKQPLGESAWDTRPLDVAAIAFLISIASFILSSVWDWGSFDIVVRIAGSATCGFAWLLARSFFKPNANSEIWPLIIVGLLIGIALLLRVFAAERGSNGALATILGMAAYLHTLVSSTVLLLAFLEPWFDYRPDLPQNEKRFRLIFMAFYGALLMVGVLWLNASSEGSWADRSGDTIRLFCAAMAAAVSIFGWRYRRENPHPKRKRQQRKVIATTVDEENLSKRILAQLKEGEAFLEPDLTLSDLAEALDEKEHKVRNCITGILSFRNFNHMINHYRIMAAKNFLMDPSRRGASILTIAFESGFSSIGPFNRAFKQETGQTPSSFRKRESH